MKDSVSTKLIPFNSQKFRSVLHSRPFFLICILVVAFMLRFWNVGTNPPGIMPDEADFGYAAFSILHTGSTSYGRFQPFLFYVPGDYYPPLYTYILIPLIWIFGLSITIVRLPSVLFGTLSCLLMYKLIDLLIRDKTAALFGALLMTFNPWSLFYSRQGRFEMIGIALVLGGIVLFLAGIKRNNKTLRVWSAIVLGISLFANDATKIVTPFLVLALALYAWTVMQSKKRTVFIFIGIFSLFFLLMIKTVFIDGQIHDFTQASHSFTAHASQLVDTERRYSTAPPLIKRFFHNKATVVFNLYLKEYISIYSLDWFFVNGHGHPQESIGRYGQYLLFELPFFFIGMFVVAQKKRETLLLLFWLLVAHIPGAITTGRFFPYRSILLLPVPVVFTSVGIAMYINWLRLRSRWLMWVIGGATTLVCIVITTGFIVTYFYEFPVYTSEWRYKQKTDALRYAHNLENTYDAIVVDGRFEPTHAFMKATDPAEYRYAVSHPIDYQGTDTIKLGKYLFGDFPIQTIATPSSYFPKNALVIAEDLPPGVQPIASFVGTEPLRPVYVAFENLPKNLKE